ncbi:putative dimethylaniline monooxygenase [Coleophoma cylindrospora]|uniref:Putative dimethylaniline monooxygenase n=1 Tax=Coleophoma cylindrospora TaxID=1849047 RepID=A0A3D8RAA3_9HELO|nr:putative dimethylaniline monooxygenase [Coleophoma cylindrospora]
MAPNSRYRRVAVIGSGPSGLSAVHALSQEKSFDSIRVFERRDRIGGRWLYDAVPDSFPESNPEAPNDRTIPTTTPSFTSPAAEDKTSRTGIYEGLDSNVGAGVMEFTHTPFPKVNSAGSVEKYGRNNPTRPYEVIAQYLEDLFTPYLHLVTLNTTIEKLEKDGEEWVVTLRQSRRKRQSGSVYDYWWTEKFDAVIVASGHYNVASIPSIPGLAEFQAKYPERLGHSKAFRSANDYINKQVVVVGGNVSASDLVIDLHQIVKGPLHLAQRGSNPALKNVWTLPNVKVRPEIVKLSIENNGTVHFSDGTNVSNIDKILFATGYRLSYPFIKPNPVTPSNRLAGFYQHIFQISDPSLAVIGQVRAALSFRIYEYQAVAVARYFAGRTSLPSVEQQQDWEKKRLAYKGPSTLFHEIAPDFKDYFNLIRDLAGPPAEESDAYKLPAWQDSWPEEGFAVLALKDKLVQRLNPRPSEIKAKL